MPLPDLFLAALFAFIPMLIFTDWKILLILSPMALSHLWLTRYFKKWIGGYTGDCLDTCQRAGEIVCYLSITALWG